MSRWTLTLALLLSLLAGTARAQTILTTPALSPPSATGDIVAFRLQNTSTGGALAAGWTTIGHVFKAGQVANTDGIRLRVCTGVNCATGSYIYAQMDVLSKNSDNSVRHAAISFKTNASIPATVGSHPVDAASNMELMINDCTVAGVSCPTAPSPVAPDNTAIAAGTGLTGADVSVKLCYTVSCAPTYTQTLSCQSIMTASNAAGTTQTWLNGPAVKGYIANAAIAGNADSGKIKVTCVWYAYAESGAHNVDVILGNDWAWSGGKSDPITESVAIGPSGSEVAVVANLKHYLYSTWDYNAYSSGVLKPVEDGGSLNVVEDAAYLNDTGAFDQHDTTHGIMYGTTGGCTGDNVPCSVADELAAMVTACGSAAPVTPLCANNAGGGNMIYGLWIADFHTGGGGPGRALASNPSDYWMYVLSGDPDARKVMMGMSRSAGSVPWHFTDETCSPDCLNWGGLPVNVSVYTGFRGSPALANGDPVVGGTPSANGDWWGNSGDSAHNYDFNYLPFLFSAKYFDFRELQYAYDTENFLPPNNYTAGGYAPLVGSQVRGNAWTLRAVERAAYITPDAYPLKSYWTTELANNLNAQLHYARDIDISHLHGLMRWEAKPSTGDASGFQTSYLVGSLYDLAIKGIPTISAQAHQRLATLKAGNTALLVNGQLGMQQNDGGIYYVYTSALTIDQNHSPELTCDLSSACDFAAVPAVTFKQFWDFLSPSCPPGGYFTDDSGHGCSNHHEWSGFFHDADQPVGGAGFEALYLSAAIASEIQDAFSYEAWAYAATMTYIISDSYTGFTDAAKLTKSIQQAPAKFMPVRMPNGHLVTWNHIQVDLTRTPVTKTLTCSGGDSLLSGYQLDISGSTYTLEGCAGTDDILYGNHLGATIFKPGTGNSYMICPYTALGTCTFWGNTGSNTMRGSSGFSGGADIYCFVSGAAPVSGPCNTVSTQATSGSDTVLNFNPATDTLGIRSDGGSCDTAPHIVTSCMAQSGDDTVLTINGKTVTFTGIRDKTALQSRITMI